MKTLTFSIVGNHKGHGNPLPKLKMTGNQSWTSKAKDYVAWKQFVLVKFLESLDATEDYDTHRICEYNLAKFGKPIVLGKVEHAILCLKFLWANNGHGDPENCLGSIADALFWNDKNVDVHTESFDDPVCKGQTFVSIRIFKDGQEKFSFLEKQNAA